MVRRLSSRRKDHVRESLTGKLSRARAIGALACAGVLALAVIVLAMPTTRTLNRPSRVERPGVTRGDLCGGRVSYF
jgi:hypothetical protein